MKKVNKLAGSRVLGYNMGYICGAVLAVGWACVAMGGLGWGVEKMEDVYGHLRFLEYRPKNGRMGCKFTTPTDHVHSYAVFKIGETNTVVVEEMHAAEDGYSVPPSMVNRLMADSNTNGWQLIVTDGPSYTWNGYIFPCRRAQVLQTADNSALCLIHTGNDARVHQVQFISSDAGTNIRYNVIVPLEVRASE